MNDTTGPVKTLRAFKRTDVAAGKTVNAIVTLSSSAFEFYDEKLLQMAVTPGEYELWYGNSSAAKDLKKINITIR